MIDEYPAIRSMCLLPSRSQIYDPDALDATTGCGGSPAMQYCSPSATIEPGEGLSLVPPFSIVALWSAIVMLNRSIVRDVPRESLQMPVAHMLYLSFLIHTSAAPRTVISFFIPNNVRSHDDPELSGMFVHLRLPQKVSAAADVARRRPSSPFQ